MTREDFNNHYQIYTDSGAIVQKNNYSESVGFVEQYSEDKTNRLNQLRSEFIMNYLIPSKIELFEPYYKILNIVSDKCYNSNFKVGFSELYPEHLVDEITIEELSKIVLIEDLSLKYDAITMFDSICCIENLEEILPKINTKYLFTSVPNCLFNNYLKSHGYSIALEYFSDWKHRLQNNHLYHFDYMSLSLFFNDFSKYAMMGIDNMEDEVRRYSYKRPVIISTAFTLKTEDVL